MTAFADGNGSRESALAFRRYCAAATIRAMSSAKPRRGALFVIAAPSGAGKTSLVKAVLDRDPSLRVSVSHTTRKPRAHEVSGEHYWFVEADEFRRLVDAGEFLEHAQVFDNFYGTSRAQVEALRNAGHDVILEIDWQGAQQVRKALPDCHSVFILPPSRRELEVRLRNRQTDSNEVIERRLRDSIADMSHYREFDSVVVNEKFEDAVTDLMIILKGSKAYGPERPELKPLIADLLG
jgi:guanylate kinase